MPTPLAATIFHGAIIWLWHVPVLFDAAVSSLALHRLQHLCFLVSAVALCSSRTGQIIAAPAMVTINDNQKSG